MKRAFSIRMVPSPIPALSPVLFCTVLIGYAAGRSHEIFVPGYPILGVKKSFGSSNVSASKDDWNKLIVVQKVNICDRLAILFHILTYQFADLILLFF